MRSTLAVGFGLALSLPGVAAIAASKPPAQKAPPACAAITFRPLPSGMTDGEQQAGMYKSRHARLALHAQVKQGEPVDYFVVAGGKRLAGEPARSCHELRCRQEDAAAGNPCVILHRSTLHRGRRSCRERAPGNALCARRLYLALLHRRKLLTRVRGSDSSPALRRSWSSAQDFARESAGPGMRSGWI